MYDLINNWDSDKKVNSGFGPRSAASTNGIGSTDHKGIDLSSSNYNIPAVVSGKVVANGYNSGRGNYITILGNDGYTATYQHLASRSPLQVGASVTEGQTIGTQGRTGKSTGDHLHFEVKSGSGVYVDPVDYLAGKFSTGSPGLEGLTGSNDQPTYNSYNGTAVSSSWTDSLLDTLLEVLGKIIKFVALAALVILAMVLFMKAFDIQMKPF